MTTPDTQDRGHGARDDVAPLMTAGLLVRKPGLSHDMFTRYWRDVHGPLAARIKGFHQYWQHHLGAPRPALWPMPDVDQSVPDSRRIEGFAETTFRDAADRERLGQDPAARALYVDEQNVFGATFLCASATGDSHTYLDRFDDAAPQGQRPHPSYIVLMHRKDGVSQDMLATGLRDRLVPPLMANPDIMKLRLHLLQPYNAAAWNTPGVRHDMEPAAQPHAILEIAFRDAEAEHRATASPTFRQAGDELKALVSALQTYPVIAIYTEIFDGRPTLVGLKGLSVAETILAAEAHNQASTEVLRLLHGPDIQAPPATERSKPV